MLYVVGEFLPKTDFLTKVDQCIVMTTMLLPGLGITVFVTAEVDASSRPALAEQINQWAAILLAGGWLAANIQDIEQFWVRTPSKERKQKET